MKTKDKIQIDNDKITITTKGKQHRYKYETEIPIDIYVLSAKTGINPKRYITEIRKKGKKAEENKERRTLRKYTKRYTKHENIQRIIRKGKSKATIHNAETITPQQLKEVYRKLLRPLVMDKKLIDIMAESQNMNKLKYKLEEQIIFKGERETIGTTQAIASKSIEETIQDIREIRRTVTEVNDYSLTGSRRSGARINEEIERKGYNQYRHENNGRIVRTEIHITMR